MAKNKLVDHVVAEQDLEINPDLKDAGIAVGETIQIPDVPETKKTKDTKGASKTKNAPKPLETLQEEDEKLGGAVEAKHKLVGKKYRKSTIIKADDIIINGVVRTKIDLGNEVITLSEDDYKYIQ